jgi:hypothetical protein
MRTRLLYRDPLRGILRGSAASIQPGIGKSPRGSDAAVWEAWSGPPDARFPLLRVCLGCLGVWRPGARIEVSRHVRAVAVFLHDDNVAYLRDDALDRGDLGQRSHIVLAEMLGADTWKVNDQEFSAVRGPGRGMTISSCASRTGSGSGLLEDDAGLVGQEDDEGVAICRSGRTRGMRRCARSPEWAPRRCPDSLGQAASGRA